MPFRASVFFRQCWILFGVLAVTVGLRAQGDKSATAPAASSAEAPFAETVRNWMTAGSVPGVAIVLRQNGQTTFYNFGEADVASHRPVTSDSIFELASITKVFTTTLLALALDRGEMSLDDPVVRWLPELADGADITKVTLRQLATHTSSLPRTPGVLSWHSDGKNYTHEEFFRYLREWHAEHPPGTRREYSNIAMGLIGLALEARAQKNFGALLSEEVLTPLGMTSTAIRLTPEQHAQLVQGYGPEKSLPVGRTALPAWPGSGSLCSSGHDMARFLEANLGESHAPPKLLAAMHHAQQGESKVSDHFMQALAWQYYSAEGATLIDKNGSYVGSSTYIGMVPEKHLGLIILVNRGKRTATLLGRRILSHLTGVTWPTSAARPPDGDVVTGP